MIGRVRQTILAATAYLRPVGDELARDYLSDAEFKLFMQMKRSDRQHHLRLLTYLLKRNHSHPALLTAALLHDTGKSTISFSIVDRILAVIVKKLWPTKFKLWSKGEPIGWKKPFVASVSHPRWGAELLAAAGGDELAVALVRHHQDQADAVPPDLRELLGLLQEADDRS
ncbi:MAG: HD domain-containing protein [Chloroflexi bacterium]|nr:HD domain-containing protein [Chloroflexota bacterium]